MSQQPLNARDVEVAYNTRIKPDGTQVAQNYLKTDNALSSLLARFKVDSDSFNPADVLALRNALLELYDAVAMQFQHPSSLAGYIPGAHLVIARALLPLSRVRDLVQSFGADPFYWPSPEAMLNDVNETLSLHQRIQMCGISVQEVGARSVQSHFHLVEATLNAIGDPRVRIYAYVKSLFGDRRRYQRAIELLSVRDRSFQANLSLYQLVEALRAMSDPNAGGRPGRVPRANVHRVQARFEDDVDSDLEQSAFDEDYSDQGPYCSPLTAEEVSELQLARNDDGQLQIFLRTVAVNKRLTYFHKKGESCSPGSERPKCTQPGLAFCKTGKFWLSKERRCFTCRDPGHVSRQCPRNPFAAPEPAQSM